MKMQSFTAPMRPASTIRPLTCMVVQLNGLLSNFQIHLSVSSLINSAKILAPEPLVKDRKEQIEKLNDFEEAAKQVSSNTNVTITLKDSSGTVQSTVSVTCKDLTQDGVLKVFKVDAPGNFIMTDGKKNTAAIKDDELQLKLDASGNYELVTKKQGKAIEKKILASVKPKKKSETIHKGKSFRFEFAKGFNKKNIEKITYSTKDTIVKVSKNGKIKALAKGEATVTVTVKLVNGKTKTVRMTIKVK